MNAMTNPNDSPDDLHKQVEALADLNDILRDMLAEQRDVYETALTAFAATGYRPAAQLLLAIREARARAQEAAREVLTRVREGRSA